MDTRRLTPKDREYWICLAILICVGIGITMLIKDIVTGTPISFYSHDPLDHSASIN